MSIIGTVLVRVEADIAKLVSGVARSKKLLDSLEKRTQNVTESFKNMALGVVGIYSVETAFTSLKEAIGATVDVASQFEQFTNRMSAFSPSLSVANSEVERATKLAQDFNLSIANTNETLLLMKNYGLKDSNEQMKIYANTAMGAGKSIDQFAEAMADALTGEFERLKEFGVKSSSIGEKVGFSWSDSSGKTRSIIVSNNKEVIDSTLSAIYNEKYVGQLDKWKNSYAGVMQGISNKMTMFKKSIADAGLFNYVRSVGTALSSYLSGGFGDATSSAKYFSDFAIGAIRSLVNGMGVLIDTVSLLKGGFALLSSGFYTFVGSMSEGINYLQAGWVSFTNNMSQIWAGMSNSVKSIFSGVVNFIIDGLNVVIGRVNGISEFFNKGKVFDEIGKFEIEMSIAPVKDTVKQLAISRDAINGFYADAERAKKSYEKEVKKGFAGDALAFEFLQKIDSTKGKNLDELARLKKEKADAQKKLNDIGAKYGPLSPAKKEPKSPASTKSKINEAKELYKEYLKLTGQVEKLSSLEREESFLKFKNSGAFSHEALLEIEIALNKKSLSEHLQDAWDSIKMGNLKGAIDSAWMGIKSESFLSAGSKTTGTIGRSMQDGSSFNKAVGDEIRDGIDSIPIFGDIANFVGGLFSSEVSQVEIDKATGRTDLNDSSIQDMGSVFEKAMNPQLNATYTMSQYLKNMEKDFGIVAQAIVGSVGGSSLDLTGMNYVPTEKYGTLGFSSKTTELLGTGLDLGGTLGDIDASGYISELVKKSSWWGLSKSTSLKITDVDLPQETLTAINDAMNDGIATILTAGTALGFDQESLDEQIEAYNIEIGKINLQDMNEEDASKAISNAFSEIFSGAIDGTDLVSLTDKYSQIGEDSLGTLTRIATEYEQASYAFNQAGMALSDSVSGLYTEQEKYLDIVEFSGGLDKFNENYSAFIDKYYTDAEKQQMSYDALATQFDNLGVAMPTTDDGFRELVNSYDVVDEATAQTKAELLGLSTAFSDLNDSIAESVLAIYDLYTGDLSYYTEQQKEDFLLKSTYTSDDSSTTTEMMEDYLKSLKETSTREDYMSAYNEYVAMKREELSDATNSDLLTELSAIRSEIEELKIATQDGVRMT